jgi:hypothetical protein
METYQIIRAENGSSREREEWQEIIGMGGLGKNFLLRKRIILS